MLTPLLTEPEKDVLCPYAVESVIVTSFSEPVKSSLRRLRLCLWLCFLRTVQARIERNKHLNKTKISFTIEMHLGGCTNSLIREILK